MEVAGRLAGYLARFPVTTEALWTQVLILATAHLLLGTIVRAVKGQSPFGDKAAASLWQRVGTAVAFGTSVMLLIGLVDPNLLALIGDTKPFLAIAGLAGVYHGIISLGRKD